MKKIILLTSNQYAPYFIDFLRQQHFLVKVFVEEESKVLQSYFKQLFPTVDVDIFNEKKLKNTLTSDVNLVVFGFKPLIKNDILNKVELA